MKEKDKNLAMWLIIGLIMAIIFIFWGFSLKSDLTSESQEKERNTDFEEFQKEWSKIFDEAKKGFGKLEQGLEDKQSSLPDEEIEELKKKVEKKIKASANESLNEQNFPENSESNMKVNTNNHGFSEKKK